MQYVGRFVSSVYNTITPNINPATLSGAIDVIVVEREVEIEEEVDEEEGENENKPRDWQEGAERASSPSLDSRSGMEKRKRKRKRWTTELASTPFHVRFGKMSVLRPGERKVTLHLNNSSEPLPFAMKVGEQGEAFFVVEVDEDENAIPDDLVTSPILSATSSPLASPGLEGAEVLEQFAQGAEFGTSYVEPLDLDNSRIGTAAAVGAGIHPSPPPEMEEAAGESDMDAKSASNTIATSVTADTDITSPGNSRSPSADKAALGDYRPSGRPDSPDLEVPSDSGLAGSGPSAGSSSLLGHLGHAASRAGGAIAEAGRAVGVSASVNPRLDKLARRSSKLHRSAPTGAPVDEEKGDAHEYDPQQGEAAGQQQQEHADVQAQAEDGGQEDTEAEKLEQAMKRKTDERIRTGTDVLERAAQGDNGSDSKAERERRPSREISLPYEESYPAPFGSREEGKQISSPRITVRSGSNTYPVSQMEHSDFLAGMPDLAQVGVDLQTTSSHLASRPAEGDGVSEIAHSSKETSTSRKTEARDKDEVGPSKPVIPRSKEELQYLLDMDGYKMTTDGEDIAFAEGHRLADELPLSRRHGGNERHAHIGEYLDTAHRREGVALESQAPPKNQAGTSAQVENNDPALQSLLGLRGGTPPLTSRGSNHNQDDIIFGQDLAAVARSLLPPGQEVDGLEALQGIPTAKRQTNRATGAVHQDGSLSDADANDVVDDPDSSHGSGLRNRSHLRAKSGPFDYSLGRVLPGDADPPAHYDGSPEAGAWSLDRAGAPLPRHRVLSSGAGDGISTSRSEALDLLRQHHKAPRFRGFEGDPYTFEVVLEDGTERHFAMSLCFRDGFGAAPSNRQGNEGFDTGEMGSSEDDRDDFEVNRISFQRFVEDPDVVNDERLVLLYNDRYLTWENASAVLATLSLYRKTFASAKAAEEEAVMSDEPVASRDHRASVWSRWWNRNRQLEGGEDGRALREASAPPEDHPATHPANDNSPAPGTQVNAAFLERTHSDPALLTESRLAQPGQAAPPPKTGPHKTYAKTLRLTSDQLKSLNLKRGANNITFSVTSSYSGVATCTARIFLWESKHHIVVSDIDGTITKSDALGHVFTMIGRDWTHLGVAKLYTDIARNGYRIMYLTSRAIGQADTTRDYLRGINQNNYRLPDGPVIMSPDRLIASLHREVILRKPEVFKMACLRDIARLFGADPRHAQAQPGGNWPGSKTETAKAALRNEADSSGATTSASGVNPTPFYAGFGNRITDALSYRSVNIPSSRIFTIDTNGEVKMELLELAGYKSSYIHMTDLVDQMFPPITQKSSVRHAGKPEFSDFNYWRPSMGDFELPDDKDLMPSPPVSPALSARSGRSVRSTTSVRSGRGAGGNTQREKGTAGSGGPSAATLEADSQQQSQGRLSRFGLGSLSLSRKGSVQTIAEGAASDASSRKKTADNPSGFGVNATAGGSTSASDLSTHNTMEGSASAPELQPVQRASTSPNPTSSGGAVSSSAEWVTEGASAGGAAGGPGASSSWISSPWRRRAVSPGTLGPGNLNGGSSATMGTASGMSSPPSQATSPLVGPVISAHDPDSDDDEDGLEEEGEYEEEYDDDDDVDDDGDLDDDDDDDDDDVSSFESGDDDRAAPGGEGTSARRRRTVSSRGTRGAGGQGRGPPRGASSGGVSREADGSAAGGGDLGGNAPVESPLEDDELLATGEVHFDWRG